MKMLAALGAMVATSALAQVTIDSRGVRSGGTVIDATGVHTAGASVDAAGVHRGRARGAGLVIDGNGATRRIDCGGGSATINGNDNRLTIARCRAVTVAGNRNQIAVAFDAPGRITVVGNRDHVTYTAAPRLGVAISNVGTGSSVSRR